MNVPRSLLDEVLPRFDASEVHAAPLKQVTVGEIRLLKPLEAMRARGRPLRAALSFRTVAESASLRAMRILVAGASGVLGRSTLPHLDRHEVVGLTRRGDKLQLLRDLGAEGVVCDVYDYPMLLRVTRRARPQIIVNFLTDLSAGSDEANIHVRREGAANLLTAATAAKAARLVVESVAFPLHGDAARALEQLEQSTRKFPGDALILRFGRIWGPETLHQTPSQPPTVHIEKAGAEASRLITRAPPGTYVVT